jgi:predicted O-methyltransferase YrrM
MDPRFIDIVSVGSLHERLGFDDQLHYPPDSLFKAFADWKMEVDDAPIFRYLYRQLHPSRHLEFGTWEGTGACYCLEESEARVWTINLPQGEFVNGQPAYSSAPPSVPEGAHPVTQSNGVDVYQTDAGAFIGHRYRSAGFADRVTQIYADTREWDKTEYGAGFFDTALIDGGHSRDVVLSDTRKALSVVRSGGLLLWHDFCPDPSVFESIPSISGVVGAVTEAWPEFAAHLKDAFWIQPSFLLAGIRA